MNLWAAFIFDFCGGRNPVESRASAVGPDAGRSGWFSQTQRLIVAALAFDDAIFIHLNRANVEPISRSSISCQ